jgi:hypothetical protein
VTKIYDALGCMYLMYFRKSDAAKLVERVRGLSQILIFRDGVLTLSQGRPSGPTSYYEEASCQEGDRR